MTWTIYINFRSPFPRRLHIQFGFDWPSGFGEGRSLENGGRRTKTDGRRLDGYTISSPCEPIGSGELKTNKIGQGQPRVIIYINFVELESQMLHAKFQDHKTSGSGEDF